ncbi:MAG TPA: hypothetical protein VN673_05770 [Clostridia bacterium]|nr:hypothetical protein [Clostridia bacterium]
MRTLTHLFLATGLILHAVGQPAATNSIPEAAPRITIGCADTNAPFSGWIQEQRPATGREHASLSQRTYRTDTNSFLPYLRALVKAQPEQSDLKVLVAGLKQKGVEVSPPGGVYYKPRTGVLLIRATAEEHKKIEKLLLESKS